MFNSLCYNFLWKAWFALVITRGSGTDPSPGVLAISRLLWPLSHYRADHCLILPIFWVCSYSCQFFKNVTLFESRDSLSYHRDARNHFSCLFTDDAGDGLHYKKDGSLDMRYSTSRAAASAAPTYEATVSSSKKSNDLLHYKKDGSLDMRYSSSKQIAGQSGNPSFPTHRLLLSFYF